MRILSFSNDVDFGDNKINTKVILESAFSKEIRILLKQGQVMKEHKAPFPIIVHVLEGEVDFGVQGDVHALKKGDIITLDASVPHDLTAIRNSSIRLTLSKLDKMKRIEKVVSNSPEH